MEERGFGSVDVFGGALVRVEDAGAEADDFAVVVGDGESDSAAEALVNLGAVFGFSAQACFKQIFKRPTEFLKGADKEMRFFGRKADFPSLGNFLMNASFFEEIARTTCFGGL